MGELYPEFITISEQIIGQNVWEKEPLKETHTQDWAKFSNEHHYCHD